MHVSSMMPWHDHSMLPAAVLVLTNIDTVDRIYLLVMEGWPGAFDYRCMDAWHAPVSVPQVLVHVYRYVHVYRSMVQLTVDAEMPSCSMLNARVWCQLCQGALDTILVHATHGNLDIHGCQYLNCLLGSCKPCIARSFNNHTSL